MPVHFIVLAIIFEVVLSIAIRLSSVLYEAFRFAGNIFTSDITAPFITVLIVSVLLSAVVTFVLFVIQQKSSSKQSGAFIIIDEFHNAFPCSDGLNEAIGKMNSSAPAETHR